MTSVSRSEHDDEAPEGTGTAVSADRGRAVTPGAQKAVTSTDAAASPTAPKKPRTPRAAKTTKSSTTSKGTTAAKAASASKNPRTTTAKNAARAATADDASGDEAKPAAAASKRTAASRAASSKAAAARGEAAKTARAARTSATKTPAARGRAATASTKRQTQQVAAALTTETTAAERANRKADEVEAAAATTAAATTAAADHAASEIDETTRERPVPRRGAAAAAASVGVAAVTAAEPVIAQRDASEAPATTMPESEVPAKADQPEAVVPAEPEVSAEPVVPAEPAEAERAVAAEEAAAPAEAAVQADPVAPAAVVAASEPEVSSAASGTAASDAASLGDQAVVVIPAPRKPAPRKKRTLRVARAAPAPGTPRVLATEGLVKKFGDNTAVDEISLDVRAGSFFGIVGPNGAGKTTTLSMVTGLLRPDAGTVRINDIDAWKDPRAAKRATGVLPDRLRLFDRLTGAQLLYYAGSLRGIDDRTVRERSTELIAAFGLEDAVDRLVADYSAGMTKKIALACAMIHAPRLLVLDEPFESVDPVSAANLTDILERYVEGGGTVLLSSHGMDLIERVCDSAAIIVGGRVLAQGTLDEVRGGTTLEDRFVELAGGRKAAEGMEWLHSFSD